jgi:hypothetical protein
MADASGPGSPLTCRTGHLARGISPRGHGLEGRATAFSQATGRAAPNRQDRGQFRSWDVPLTAVVLGLQAERLIAFAIVRDGHLPNRCVHTLPLRPSPWRVWLANMFL